MSRPIAALYVETDGSYYGLPGVDPWDEARDARLYAGPNPIVAHPPCQRWGKLWAGQPLFIKRTGIRKIKGDDDGCFKAALDAVRHLCSRDGVVALLDLRRFGRARSVRAGVV